MPTQFPTIPQHEQQRFPPEQQEGQHRSQQQTTTEISPKTPLLQTNDSDPRSTPSKSAPHPYVSAQPSIIYNHQIQQYSPGYPPVPMIGPYQINYQSTSSQNNSSSYPAYLTYGSTASTLQQEDPNLQRQLSYQYNTSGNSYDNLTSKASSTSTETGAIDLDSHKAGTESSAENSPETKSLSLKTKKPRGNRTAGYCDVCKKNILRDLKRHMRIHEDVKRFVCVYPKDCCVHKTGTFNRNYDFKKHLLHTHFEFDDPLVKKLFGLNEKLSHTGKCPCGLKTDGGTWLEEHILTDDEEKRCKHLKKLWELRRNESQFQSIATNNGLMSGTEQHYVNGDTGYPLTSVETQAMSYGAQIGPGSSSTTFSSLPTSSSSSSHTEQQQSYPGYSNYPTHPYFSASTHVAPSQPTQPPPVLHQPNTYYNTYPTSSSPVHERLSGQNYNYLNGPVPLQPANYQPYNAYPSQPPPSVSSHLPVQLPYSEIHQPPPATVGFSMNGISGTFNDYQQQHQHQQQQQQQQSAYHHQSLPSHSTFPQQQGHTGPPPASHQQRPMSFDGPAASSMNPIPVSNPDLLGYRPMHSGYPVYTRPPVPSYTSSTSTVPRSHNSAKGTGTTSSNRADGA